MTLEQMIDGIWFIVQFSLMCFGAAAVVLALVVGLPTLICVIAESIARRIGHGRWCLAAAMTLCFAGEANAQYLLPWRNTCYQQQQQQQIADLRYQMLADQQRAVADQQRQELNSIRANLERMQDRYQQAAQPIVQTLPVQPQYIPAPQYSAPTAPGNITQNVEIYLVQPGYPPQVVSPQVVPQTVPIPSPQPQIITQPPPQVITQPAPQVLPIVQPTPQQPSPPIVVLPGGGPQQQLPGGAPQQQLPGGAPQQQLPGGAPIQQLPGGAPQQQLGTPPVTQPLDPAPKPKQVLPGGAPQQQTPSGFRSFTRWRPSLKRPLHH